MNYRNLSNQEVMWRKNNNSFPQRTLPFPNVRTVSLEIFYETELSAEEPPKHKKPSRQGSREEACRQPAWLLPEGFPNGQKLFHSYWSPGTRETDVAMEYFSVQI